MTYEKCLKPLIKRRNLVLNNYIRKMEFQKKVSDWLKNNFQHMHGDIPSAFSGSNISGHFRMEHFSSAYMEMEANHSSTSVDTAAYISAQKNKSIHRSHRTYQMTIKEYCYQEKDSDFLRFDRTHQWAPVEILQRPLAIESSTKPQPIEYSKLPQDQRKNGRKAIRKKTNFREFDCTTSESDEHDGERERVKRRRNKKLPITMRNSTLRICNSDSSTSSTTRKSDSAKDSVKRGPHSAHQIVIHSPEQCQSSHKRIRITMKMLAEKIGWEMAKEMENDFYLRHSISTSSTLIFDTVERRFIEIFETPSHATPIKSPKKLKEPKNISPESDIVVIYAPRPDRAKSRRKIRITLEMLQRKLDPATVDSLRDNPFLRFPFTESSKLLFSRHTQTLYEKF